MNHKKYRDIERIKLDLIDNFVKGDNIYIEEKIDGANCSIQYDAETDTVVACSRKQILTPVNNLRGFYEFAQKLDKNKVMEILGENLILFGEWLVSHSVRYPDEKYNQMYAFDVYERTAESYLPQETAIVI
ncbi:MAG: RNA ligase family protein [Oscillospiraceae bacterium]